MELSKMQKERKILRKNEEEDVRNGTSILKRGGGGLETLLKWREGSISVAFSKKGKKGFLSGRRLFITMGPTFPLHSSGHFSLLALRNIFSTEPNHSSYNNRKRMRTAFSCLLYIRYIDRFYGHK